MGFEIFDQNRLGMTDFVQRLNYQRALQGELARTISQLSEVESARVHLSLPERRLFTRAQERPRASVVVRLHRGRRLTPEQVQGIVHLVASSVEGLDPQQVTVVDSHGNLLSRRVDLAGRGLSYAQIEFQQEVERTLQERVQQMLDRVVGPGRSVVTVTAELDFTRVETTEERYDPEGQVPRSEQRVEEKSMAPALVPGGTPGVLANQPDVAPETPGVAPTQQQQRITETINYEINRRVNRVVRPMGILKRLSVAVLIDGTYVERDGKLEYVPRSQEEMAQFVAIVKKAVGFDENRGDQVEVVNVPFQQPLEGDFPETSSWDWRVYLPLAWYALVGLAVVLGFLFVVRPLVRTITAPTPRPSLPEGMTIPSLPPETVAALEGARSATQEGENLREGVIRFAKGHPQETAKLIQSWIRESS